MRRRLAPVLALLALLFLLLGVGWIGGLRRITPPDVILITVDTLRVDHVGAFNPASPAATPHIDALAADGVRYTQAWSPISVTGPGFASLLTGLEPARHGVLMNLFRGGQALAPEHTTLAELLRDRRGYATGGFVSGFTLRRALGLNRGFTVYSSPSAEQRRRPGARTAHLALAWLDELPPWRWSLLWYHSYDPHGPLTPYTDRAPVGPQWSREPEQLVHLPDYQRIDGISDPEFYRRRYAEAVEVADAQVGRILDQLQASGRYRHALVVFTADHGESFTERALWFDHGTHASAEQLHVPLIVKYPRSRDAGQQVDALVSLVDILPTVLEVVGITLPPGLDGQVLPRPGEPGAPGRRLLGESSHCKGEAVLDCAPRGMAGKELALRSADRTVVRRSTVEGPRWQVYDRVQDPAELHGRDEEPDPQAREQMEAAAALRVARAAASQPAPGDDSPETEALRALGYLE